jgi:hypothetical protein
MMQHDRLHGNCITAIMFERKNIMSKNAVNSTTNKYKNPYKAWSVRTFKSSHAHDTFIVPWQIYDNGDDKNQSEKSDQTNK